MTPAATARHIVITGPMGSGKSTLGIALARRTGRVFLDSDDQLRAAHAQSGKVLADRFGVIALHRMELEVFVAGLATREAAVIAAAASVADHADILLATVAEGHVLVYLDASATRLAAYAAEGAHRRRVSVEETVALARVRRGNALAAGALLFPVDRARAPSGSVDALARLLGLDES
jgi:shikimate kinase